MSAVDLSIDFGTTWIKADLAEPVNPYAWQNFTTGVRFPELGYYEVWARATDDQGRMQPFAIAWNPKASQRPQGAGGVGAPLRSSRVRCTAGTGYSHARW